MAAAGDAPADGAVGGFSVAAVVEVVAAGAGLAGWITVVGGAHMWARLSAAHFAPTPSVVFQPRAALLVEGLKTLLFPLLAGAFVAVLGWYTWHPPSSDPEEDFETGFQRWLRTEEGRFQTALWWTRQPSAPPGGWGAEPPDPLPDLRKIYAQRVPEPPRTRRIDEPKVSGIRRLRRSLGDLASFLAKVWTELQTFLAESVPFLIAAVLLFLGAVAYFAFNRQGFWSVFFTLLLTALALVAGFFVVPRSKSQRGRALILFAIVVLWAGAADIIVVSGQKHPTFELARVVRKSNHKSVAGFFVANNSGDVYLAQRLETIPKYRVLMIPKADVDSFSFGPSLKVKATDEYRSGTLEDKYFAGLP
jgi:hypothetical protein